MLKGSQVRQGEPGAGCFMSFVTCRLIGSNNQLPYDVIAKRDSLICFWRIIVDPNSDRMSKKPRV